MPRPQRPVALLSILGAAALVAQPSSFLHGIAHAEVLEWQLLKSNNHLQLQNTSLEWIKQKGESTIIIWGDQSNPPMDPKSTREPSIYWESVSNSHQSNSATRALTDPALARSAGKERFVLNSDQPEWKPLESSFQSKPLPNGDRKKEIPATSSISWQTIKPSEENSVITWNILPKDLTDEIIIRSINAPTTIQRPPEPRLQSLNRSISFASDGPGPDLGWKVPQGFRWSEDWFVDTSILGANTRPPNSSFWAWNNGDAAGEVHLRVYQQQNWSFGVNGTFRSVYQGSNFAGGSTPIGNGFATGFRLDYALSKSSGIAIGAEQLIQYDSTNDSGRNIYLVGSKGWWIGGYAGSFPLLIGTAGIGTGRLGDNPSVQFACDESVAGITDVSSGKSSPLCWSPIGSAAMLLNNNWSVFTEYNSQDWIAGLSLSMNDSFPMRISWGVLLGNAGTNYNYVGNDNLRWFFRASIGL